MSSAAKMAAPGRSVAGLGGGAGYVGSHPGSTAVSAAPRASEARARAELRQAMARRDLGAGELAEAVKAQGLALRRISECEDALDVIRSDRERSEHAFDDDDVATIAALTTGRTLTTGAAAKADEVKAQHRAELEAARKARARLAAGIADRRRRLEFADAGVSEAVKCVVAACGAAEALLDGLAALEAEVVRRRVALSCVLRIAPTKAPWAEAARAVMANTQLPSPDFVPSQYVEHPEIGRWSEFAERLARDADAVIGEGPR